MTTEEIIAAAILRVRGGPFAPGQAVSHPNEPITREFVRSEGSVAITRDVEGVEYRYPIAEMFDPNAARDEAFRIKFGLPDGVALLGVVEVRPCRT